MKMVRAELEYEDLFRYVKACNGLKLYAEVRKRGEALLAMEKGPHHADAAFLVGHTYRPGSEGFLQYKKLTLRYDTDNAKGYHDEFLIDDAMAVLKSIKSKEERAAKLARATSMLEGRLAQKGQKVHPGKAQIMYGLLFQIVYNGGRGDLVKSAEYLRKGIESAPSTEQAKRMTRLLGTVKDRQAKKEAEEEAKREEEEKEGEGSGTK